MSIPKRLRCILLTSASLVLLLGANPATAQTVIFSNLGPGDSFNSTAQVGSSGAPGSVVENAVKFEVSGGSFNFHSVQLPIGAINPVLGGPINADLVLFSDSGGFPGSALETIHLTGLPETSVPTSLVNVSSSAGTHLHAGNTYWIGLIALGDTRAFWSFNDQGHGGLGQRVNGGAWEFNPAQDAPAFRVMGVEGADAVPEPGALLIFAPAFALLAILARRSNGASRIR